MASAFHPRSWRSSCRSHR